MKTFLTQRGSAALTAMIGLLLLGGLGATAVSVVSTTEETRAVSHNSEQAYALAQAGVEVAKNRINLGVNPVVSGFPLAQGTFSITTVPNSGQLVSTGTVGNVKRNFAINTQFGKDCTDLDVSQGHSAGPNLEGLKLVRNCLTQSVVTMWQVTWAPNLGEKTIKLQVQGSPLFTVYDNPAGFASGATIDGADYTLNKGAGVPEPINKIEFNGNITAGKTYTITLYLSDGSTVTKSFIDPGNGGGNPPPPAGPSGFSVSNGTLVVEANKAVTVNSLCAQITYGANGPQIPVKGWIGTRVGNSNNYNWVALFNGAALAVNGGQSYSTNSGAGSTYAIKSNAKYVQNGVTKYNATYDSKNTSQVKTLVNGDTPPPLAGFGGQAPVSQCIAGYLNQQTGKVSLSANQSIMLFELGVNMQANPNNPAADFQDAVYLITVN